MTTLSGFSPIPTDPIGPDLAPRIAAAIGKTVIDATVTTPRDILVTGPSLVAGDKPAIQTFLNGYVYDPTFFIIPADVFNLNGVTLLTWTNMPILLTEVPGSRTKIYLGGRSWARMTCHVRVIGAAGAILKVQVSLDQNTWVDGPAVPIDGVADTLRVSSLVPIPAQYQTDVFVRLAGIGGNATADPVFGLTTLQVA